MRLYFRRNDLNLGWLDKDADDAEAVVEIRGEQEWRGDCAKVKSRIGTPLEHLLAQAHYDQNGLYPYNCFVENFTSARFGTRTLSLYVLYNDEVVPVVELFPDGIHGANAVSLAIFLTWPHHPTLVCRRISHSLETVDF
jgi:hypothetical protein